MRKGRVSRPNPRSYQERLAHTRCTFAWSRITNGAFAWSSRRTFARGSITAKWRGSVVRNRGTFVGPCASYSKKGGRYAQQQDSLPQRRHAVCCRVADGRGYPLQGSTPQQQQQPRGSGGTVPAEYAAQAVTTGSQYQHRQAGYCASASCRGGRC